MSKQIYKPPSTCEVTTARGKILLRGEALCYEETRGKLPWRQIESAPEQVREIIRAEYLRQSAEFELIIATMMPVSRETINKLDAFLTKDLPAIIKFKHGRKTQKIKVAIRGINCKEGAIITGRTYPVK